MSEPTANALPIVLIHGLWMTSRSWDRWVEYYRAKGPRGDRADVPGIRDRGRGAAGKPEIIAEASVSATLDHLSDVVETPDRPPIIMGHSFVETDENTTSVARWSRRSEAPLLHHINVSARP
jgi:pimeloyl-ACP methyl ester carboxylesterase